LMMVPCAPMLQVSSQHRRHREGRGDCRSIKRSWGNAGFHPGPQTRGTLSQDVHLNADRIKFQTKDATDVVVQEIKQDVGGDSGWHSHPGFVVGIVKSGSVSITVGCATTIYSAGQTFLETGNTPVIARNATDPLVMEATYFVPKGVPTRRDANPPTC
jgi:quercetin dioxygenase-like cupin family protein